MSTPILRRPPFAARALAGGLALAGVVAVVVAWILLSATPAGALPAHGGTLVEGEAGPAPRTINPLFAAASGPEADLTHLIFSGLTRPGPSGAAEPDLAENWVVSSDGVSFTFLLRRDVQWQDGAPFTADDVVFTAQAFSAPGVKGDPATAEAWRRARVQKLDAYSVLFQFDSPFVPFLSYSSAGILPTHLLQHDSPTQLVNDPFNHHPIGTGPYRLAALTAGEARLSAVPAFYLGTPYVSHLRLRFLGDADHLQRALRTHQVQSGMLPSPVAPGDLDALRATGHTLISGLRPAYTLVYLNLNAAQFQDPAVRRALSLATDRERLVQSVLTGQATPSDVPLPPDSYTGAAHTPSGPDIAQAKALLLAAGWTPAADGVLQRRGIQLAFTLDTTPEPQRVALAQALAAQWAAIGAQVRIQTQDSNTLLNTVLLPQKYEAVLYGWDPGPGADPFPAWHSSQRTTGSNLSNYASPRADQLLEAARGAPDADGRAAIFGAFVDQFRRDMPAIVLFFPRYVYAVPQQLTPSPLGLLSTTADRFASVEQWSLDTRRD